MERTTRLERALWVGAAILFAGAMFLVGKLTENDKYIIVEKMPMKPSACVAPLWDFGVDSPALRVFLYDHIPGVCFKSRMPTGDSLCLEGHGKT